MTPEEALMTIQRLIDGSEKANDERLLQVLWKSIKTLAEKGSGENRRGPAESVVPQAHGSYPPLC